MHPNTLVCGGDNQVQMTVRVDVLWPEKADTSADAAAQHCYVVGWRLQNHLICVAAVLLVSKFTPAALKLEIEKLSKRFDRLNDFKPKDSAPLTLLGEIKPPSHDGAAPAATATGSSSSSRRHSDGAAKSIWLEMQWHADKRRPILVRGMEQGTSLAIDLCHVISYDAAFSQGRRYRHLTIRKRKRGDAKDTSATPLHSAIGHINHSFEIDQVLAQRPAATAYASKLQSILCWPFVLGMTLCRPTFRLWSWLLSAHFPDRVPFFGGKQVKSLSLFLRLLNRRIDMLAAIPEQYIKYNRLFLSDQPFHVLENGYAEFMSDLVLLVLDLVGGYTFRALVPTAIAYFQRTSHAHFRSLKAQVTWLVDAPAGFKINVALASSLGKGIHLMVDVAQYAIDGLSPYVDTILLIASAASILGLSVQLGLLYDFVEFVTLQTYYLYLYFSKLHRVQFDLLSSLWRLFLGKKKNLLRNRVDSCEYDVTQLLVGTLLFTIVFFVVATNSVFYLYFCLVRCIVLAIQTTIWCTIVFSHMIPLYSMALWVQDKFQFPSDVYLRPVKAPHALSIVFSNVHQNHCFVQDDFPATRQAETDAAIPTAYFTLHPVAFSFGALFTRVSEYGGALAKHYTVGKFLRCFLLGEYIPAIPFEGTPMRLAKATSMTTMTTKQVWEALRACSWA
ncbi:Aste57867_13621 [Aphanomyces stellatus]|uniref:Aste57867_13621 protein n=1 Tax=Aphanomyces stellatus TaxID=120398 RepID=A0A485KYM0_9STRA|nr:hypothetical protein As57867_013571 [Aphanomyces stellatus]VFT90458.1 Aste57867_13621 [Aphanomyces stellatus]